AASHCGVCLEFSDFARSEFGQLRPVNYCDDLTEVNALRLYDEGETKYREKIGERIALTKSPEWSYEQEWRSLVRPARTTHNFNPKALTGVIFGFRISPADEERVRNWIQAGRSRPRLFRAKAKHLEFGLEIIEETA